MQLDSDTAIDIGFIFKMCMCAHTYACVSMNVCSHS